MTEPREEPQVPKNNYSYLALSFMKVDTEKRQELFQEDHKRNLNKEQYGVVTALSQLFVIS